MCVCVRKHSASALVTRVIDFIKTLTNPIIGGRAGGRKPFPMAIDNSCHQAEIPGSACFVTERLAGTRVVLMGSGPWGRLKPVKPLTLSKCSRSIDGITLSKSNLWSWSKKCKCFMEIVQERGEKNIALWNCRDYASAAVLASSKFIQVPTDLCMHSERHLCGITASVYTQKATSAFLSIALQQKVAWHDIGPIIPAISPNVISSLSL